jgi:hypothetical protein
MKTPRRRTLLYGVARAPVSAAEVQWNAAWTAANDLLVRRDLRIQ